MEYYDNIVTFSIPFDYILLAGLIILIIGIVKFLNYMAMGAQIEKDKNYKPVDVSKIKVKAKVKERTIFLEDRINEFLDSDQRITVKEWRKVVSQARGYKILTDQRGRAIKDCHAFIGELRKHIEKDGVYISDKKYTDLIKSIEATNKIKK